MRRADVLKLIPLANAWHVTGDVQFDDRTVAVEWALRNLHTCWPGRATFEELAQQIMQAQGAPVAAELLSLADVARRLGVTEADVMAIVESGELPAKKIGAAVRVKRSELDAYLSR